MPKSGYLERQKAMINEVAGELIRGEQQMMFDAAVLAANRLWGKGYKSLKEFEAALASAHDEICDALLDLNEGDVKQERIDNELRAIINGRQEFYDCSKRYPYVKRRDYITPLKGVVPIEWGVSNAADRHSD